MLKVEMTMNEIKILNKHINIKKKFIIDDLRLILACKQPKKN